jgi:uncharacterized protein
MSLSGLLAAAAVTGLLGSLHCAAMCGPLALGGCVAGGRLQPRSTLGYFGGRLVSYACVGALLGHMGRHALCILPMSTVQAIALGAVALGAALRGIRLLRPAGARPVRLGRSRPSSVAALWPRRGLAMGIATGLLPCGLLLSAWLLAAGAAGALAGAAVMALFALVTAPGLVVTLVGRRLAQSMLARLPSWAHGAAWCALAAWIALRPLLVALHHCHP